MPSKQPKPKEGRPRKVISLEQVKGLAIIGCTLDEMGIVLGCSKRLLNHKKYSKVIAEGREQMKMSLRRWQYEGAKRGNPSLLIWMGKQYLGQRNYFSVSGPNDGPIELNHHGAGLTLEQLDREIAKLLPAVAGVAANLGEARKAIQPVARANKGASAGQLN